MIFTEKFEVIVSDLKAYLNTRLQLIRLETTSKITEIGSELFTSVFLGLIGFLFILFFSLTAGFYLADYFQKYYVGFGIVAGFYFLVGLILYVFRKKVFLTPIRKRIIRKILNNKG
ncbi:MAG: phage holin family protein [Bacteroidales bacterium]|nr:phage holin family protein [Bacteroidales bacterium]